LAHHNTVFAQRLKLIPRHQFESLAERHHVGCRFRKTSRWSQFVALAMGQLSGRHSLRDVVANAEAQHWRWYHLGARRITRSTLARVNEQQPCAFYEALFATLYQRCKPMAPQHRFRFRNPLYSIDSSWIDLSLKIFPSCQPSTRADLRSDHRANGPEVTPGNTRTAAPHCLSRCRIGSALCVHHQPLRTGRRHHRCLLQTTLADRVIL